MTQTTHTMVVGTSEPQDFQLLDDGVALVGAGWTVAIEFRAPAPATPPTVAWLNQATGTVRVTGCASMPVGRYYCRFRITDGDDAEAFVPGVPAALEWRVIAV